MKKITLLLLSVLCSMATFADDTPLFQSDFNTVDDFNRWTVVNSNGDDYTWTFYESSGHQTASVRWNDDKATDDWLISPASRLLPTACISSPSLQKLVVQARRRWTSAREAVHR